MTIKKHRPKVWFIILAAGKGALDPKHAGWRPKLLEQLNGHPVIHYVIEAAKSIQSSQVAGITVVISTRFEDVLRAELKNFQNINIAVQDNHRGTADAVYSAIEQEAFPQAGQADYIVVLMGDQPLITSHDLDEFIQSFVQSQPSRAGILTFRGNRRLPEFQKCGVVSRAHKLFIDLKPQIPIPQNKKLEELHAGPYIFNADWLRGIITILGHYQRTLPVHSPEFHLYDALVAAREDTGVHMYRTHQPQNMLGVDTVEALDKTRRRMAQRRKTIIKRNN